jgi:hypothetical protein
MLRNNVLQSARLPGFPTCPSLSPARKNLELAQSTHAQVRFHINKVDIELGCEKKERRSNLSISCKWLDWQASHLAQILGQSPAMISKVDNISIDNADLQFEPGLQDDMDDTDWLELLRPFTAAKTLQGSKQLAVHIARALDGVSGDSEMVTKILPALDSISLEDQPVESVEKFVAVRQLSGHPVAFYNRGTSCGGCF